MRSDELVKGIEESKGTEKIRKSCFSPLLLSLPEKSLYPACGVLDLLARRASVGISVLSAEKNIRLAVGRFYAFCRGRRS